MINSKLQQQCTFVGNNMFFLSFRPKSVYIFSSSGIFSRRRHCYNTGKSALFSRNLTTPTLITSVRPRSSDVAATTTSSLCNAVLLNLPFSRKVVLKLLLPLVNWPLVFDRVCSIIIGGRQSFCRRYKITQNSFGEVKVFFSKNA